MHVSRRSALAPALVVASSAQAPEDRAREILLSGRSRLSPALRIAVAHSAWRAIRANEWATRAEGSPVRVSIGFGGAVSVEIRGALGMIEPAPASWARPIPAIAS
jgi:hypothetical protein